MTTLTTNLHRIALRLRPVGIVALTVLDYAELYIRRGLVLLMLVALGCTIVCGGSLVAWMIVDLIQQAFGA